MQALKEKELGNEAYKKKDFETALKHYDEAFKQDPTNMTYLSNQAGMRSTHTPLPLYPLVMELSLSLQHVFTGLEICAAG